MESLRVYSDPKIFWREVSPQLLNEEVKNCLFLGLANTFQQSPAGCVYQSALFHGDQLLGALNCSLYNGRCFFLPSPISDGKVAQKLFQSFQYSQKIASSIVGDRSTALLFQKLFDGVGVETKVHVEQGLYKCEQVKVPVGCVGAYFRVVNAHDKALLADWLRDFSLEAIPHDPPGDWQAMAEDRINRGVVYFLEVDGRPVSSAAWGRDFGSTVSINFVYTPKDLRGRGYASLVTALLTEKFLQQGKKSTNLFTDLSNPTSNKIYREIGYEYVSDSIHIGIGS